MSPASAVKLSAKTKVHSRIADLRLRNLDLNLISKASIDPRLVSRNSARVTQPRLAAVPLRLVSRSTYLTNSISLGRQLLSKNGSSGLYRRRITKKPFFGSVWIQLPSLTPPGLVGLKHTVVEPSDSPWRRASDTSGCRRAGNNQINKARHQLQPLRARNPIAISLTISTA